MPGQPACALALVLVLVLVPVPLHIYRPTVAKLNGGDLTDRSISRPFDVRASNEPTEDPRRRS